MSSVYRRTIRSNPHRGATETWTTMVDLLTQGRAGAAYDELTSVSGIACSIITEKVPKDHPIVVTCDGPRTRLYCLYDGDALDESAADEAALGYDPLKGDWKVSLPCPDEDLDWVQKALEKKSSRITARSQEEGLEVDKDAKASASTGALVVDPKKVRGL